MTATDQPGGAAGTAESRLRRLASTRSSSSPSELDAPYASARSAGLGSRTRELVRLAALVARGAPASSYRVTVDAAVEAGASVEDIVGTLLAVAPTVGLSRVVSSTAGLSLALGYDIDAALECLDAPTDRWAERQSRAGT